MIVHVLEEVEIEVQGKKIQKSKTTEISRVIMDQTEKTEF